MTQELKEQLNALREIQDTIPDGCDGKSIVIKLSHYKGLVWWEAVCHNNERCEMWYSNHVHNFGHAIQEIKEFINS